MYLHKINGSFHIKSAQSEKKKSHLTPSEASTAPPLKFNEAMQILYLHSINTVQVKGPQSTQGFT